MSRHPADHETPARPRGAHLPWLDQIKGVALVWILFNHVSEQLFEYPLIANPSRWWPPLEQRIAQLRPLPIVEWRDWVANIVRYVGWFGEQGVGLFLICSGFALCWVQLNRPARALNWKQHLTRRFSRLFPTWWVAHLAILLPPALIGWQGASVVDWEFYLSMLGIRITPGQLYYGVPSWWFIGLILQLYLVFPPLYRACSKYGARRTLLAAIVISVIIRCLGLMYFVNYLDAWSRGAIFFSRSTEFLLGMAFAMSMSKDRQSVLAKLSSTPMMFAALAALLVGNVASLSLPGMAVAPGLMATGGFVLLLGIARTNTWNIIGLAAITGWIGRHSLSVFLVHYPVIYFLKSSGTIDAEYPLIAALAVTFATFPVAIFLEAVTNLAERICGYAIGRWGRRGLCFRLVCCVGLLWFIVVPLELIVRKYDPQDIPDFGWAERPSLQPDENLGYRLRCNSRTHLRWESYDYVLEGNSEGFPGPDFEFEKSPETFRIMVVGDAYTSAEGVDTNDSWPRVLEDKLQRTDGSRASSSKFEVINFGVTGFGPEQYAHLVQTYVPKIDPDLIVIGFFTNEFYDSHIPIERFREMIGFDRPDPECLRGILTARHFCRWLRGNVVENLYERILRRPSPHTRFFLQSDAFEVCQLDYISEGQQKTWDHMRLIRDTANKYATPVLVAAIPAPIQVTNREDLEWLRPMVTIDESTYDFEMPQRLTKQITDDVGFNFFDLRPVLIAVKDQRPYQSLNLHFTERGHEAVAEALVEEVLSCRKP